MRPNKRWLVTGFVLITYSAGLWAQSDLSCYTCGALNKHAKAKSKTLLKAEPQAVSVPRVVRKSVPKSTRTTKPPAISKVRTKYPTILAVTNDPGPNLAEVKALRDLVEAQQKQLEAQGEQLNQFKTQMQQMLEATQTATVVGQKAQKSADRAQECGYGQSQGRDNHVRIY